MIWEARLPHDVLWLADTGGYKSRGTAAGHDTKSIKEQDESIR